MAAKLTDDLGDRVRQARLDSELTQEQLAPKLGVTLRTLQRLERGQTKNVSVGLVQRVAWATEKPISYFFTEVAA